MSYNVTQNSRIALFAYNVSDYSTWYNENYVGDDDDSGTVLISSKNLPELNSKYKAIISIPHSEPLDILGASEAFDILPISAALTTDKLSYYEGELINLTCTMSRNSDMMEDGIVWIGLFAHNVTDYSSPLVINCSRH